MKGKVLVANYKTAFHGYRTGMAELENRGFNHEKVLQKKLFLLEKKPLQLSTTSLQAQATWVLSERVGWKNTNFRTSR